jgi:hypothetical protein
VEGAEMTDYIITARVTIRFTVEAESEEQARTLATNLKKFSMTSPDGEPVEIDEDDIVQVEVAE